MNLPVPIPTRTDVNLNSAADVNALMTNCQALADALHPVGETYTQYPSVASNDMATAFPEAQEPASLYGGTWTEEFDDEAVFFRTPGKHLEATQDVNRTDGKQLDYSQDHQHGSESWYGSNGDGAANPRNQGYGANGPYGNTVLSKVTVVSGAFGTPRVGLENYPVNRIKRVWRRTA